MAPISCSIQTAILLQALLLTTTNVFSVKFQNTLVSRQRSRSLTLPVRSTRLSLPHKSPTLLVRGGEQSPSDPYASYADYNPGPPDPRKNPEDGFSNYNPPAEFTEAEHIFQESVQDRVDKWRQTQMEQRSKVTPAHEFSPRDDQGRMKLISNVSRGSRALMFFIIMWRDIHLFELADQSLKGFGRTIMVVPLILLFIGNMAGAVASFTSPTHSGKKRMKAIMNLDKVVEGVLLVWYFFRLTVAPSKYIPREVFVAKTLHSVMFLVQLQAFTRFTW